MRHPLKDDQAIYFGMKNLPVVLVKRPNDEIMQRSPMALLYKESFYIEWMIPSSIVKKLKWCSNSRYILHLVLQERHSSNNLVVNKGKGAAGAIRSRKASWENDGWEGGGGEIVNFWKIELLLSRLSRKLVWQTVFRERGIGSESWFPFSLHRWRCLLYHLSERNGRDAITPERRNSRMTLLFLFSWCDHWNLMLQQQQLIVRILVFYSPVTSWLRSKRADVFICNPKSDCGSTIPLSPNFSMLTPDLWQKGATSPWEFLAKGLNRATCCDVRSSVSRLPNVSRILLSLLHPPY